MKTLIINIIVLINCIYIKAQVVDSLTNYNHQSIYFSTYVGVMLPQSNINEFSPSVGVSIIPTLNNRFFLPIDLAIFYQDIHNKKKWVPRISSSIRYNTITVNQFTHFLQLGGGIQFTTEPLNFNISTGIIIKKIFIEGRILIWRESGDNSSIMNNSGLIFTVGIQL